MPNTIITPTIVAQEMMMQLNAKLVMGSAVHRGYSKEFVKVGDTITVKGPSTFVSEHVGAGMSTQNLAESKISLTIDKHEGVLVSFTAEDAAMKITDFSEQIVVPACNAIVLGVDTNLMALSKSIPYIRQQSSTPDLADLAFLSADLNVRLVPEDQRSLILDPMSYAKYMAIPAISSLANRGNQDAVANGKFSRAMGFDIAMSQQVPTEGVLVGSLTDSLTPAAVSLAATDMTVTDADATPGLLPAGYVFKIAGDAQPYTLTADATQTATGIKIYFAPGLKVAILSAKVITGEAINGSGKSGSLALHKNAMTLVTCAMAPSQAAPSKLITSKDLNVMVTFERDTTNHCDTMLFEVLYGVKVLNEKMAERFIAA